MSDYAASVYGQENSKERKPKKADFPHTHIHPYLNSCTEQNKNKKKKKKNMIIPNR